MSTDVTHIISDNKSLISFSKHDFVVGYISTMSFDYTVNGLISLLKESVSLFSQYANIKFLIIGDGNGIDKVKKIIREYNLEKNVVLTGKIKKIDSILAEINICIIPWEKDLFTQTIVPTKLFEYLAAQKPVIVPDFGAFSNIIENNKNGLLYTSYRDLIAKIIVLKKHKEMANKIAKNGHTLFLEKYDLSMFKKKYIEFVYKI